MIICCLYFIESSTDTHLMVKIWISTRLKKCYRSKKYSCAVLFHWMTKPLSNRLKINQKTHPFMAIWWSKLGYPVRWKNASEVKIDHMVIVIHWMNEEISLMLQLHHDYELFKPLNKLSIKRIIHLWPFDGQNLDQHQYEKMLQKWELIMCCLEFLEWPKNFTQASMASWSWTFGVFEQALNQKNHPLTAMWWSKISDWKNASEVKHDHMLFVISWMNKNFLTCFNCIMILNF